MPPHPPPRSTVGRLRATPLGLWLVLVLTLAGCGITPAENEGAAPAPETTDTAETTGDLAVVATTTILGEVTERIVADQGEVATLLPRGADPHTFQPSARQVAQLQEADLVVTNGAGLESGLADALAEAQAQGVPVFTAVEHVDTLTFTGDHDHGGHDHAEDDHAEDDHAEDDHAGDDHAGDDHAGDDHAGDDHAGDDHAGDDHGEEAPAEAAATDPHIWLDPERMSDVTVALGAQVAEVGDGDGAMFRQRAAAHAEELRELSAAVADQLAEVAEPSRTLVTNHDALAYFADRYDFEIVGTVIPGGTTGAEPSAEDLETLAAAIRDRDVPAIFGETTQPVRLAEAVAAEVGRDVQVVELYTGSLGEEGSEAGTYASMMETNAERIADALGT